MGLESQNRDNNGRHLGFGMSNSDNNGSHLGQSYANENPSILNQVGKITRTEKSTR